MTRKKVFISFEYETDRALKDLLIGQSRNEGSPFEVIDGSLKEVLPDCNPKPKPISIVYPHNRHLSAKVRVFAEWIAELFESTPALEGGEPWRSTVNNRTAKQDRGQLVA